MTLPDDRRLWIPLIADKLLHQQYLADVADAVGMPRSTLRDYLARTPEVLEQALNERARRLKLRRDFICSEYGRWDYVRLAKELSWLENGSSSWLAKSGEKLLAKARADARHRELTKSRVDPVE